MFLVICDNHVHAPDAVYLCISKFFKNEAVYVAYLMKCTNIQILS